MTGKPIFRYTHSTVNDCGDPPFSSLDKRYQEVLVKQQKKFKDWTQRPFKYTKRPEEPLCLARETRYFACGKGKEDFRFRTHSTWEAFVKELKDKRVPG